MLSVKIGNYYSYAPIKARERYGNKTLILISFPQFLALCVTIPVASTSLIKFRLLHVKNDALI